MSHTPRPSDMIAVYERQAAAFDRARDKSLFEKAWLDRFISGLKPGARILDIGCGTAEPMAAYLISKQFRITGIDGAAAMIDICARRFPDHGWHVMDMRELKLNQKFDAILAWDSFFHLTANEQRQMFGRFASHMKPGAPLMFTSGTKEGEAWGQVGSEAVYHAALDPEEYRHLITRNDMTVLRFTPDDAGTHRHSIWLVQKL